MALEQASQYKTRIARDPEIMAGKPVVRGTRIPNENNPKGIENVLSIVRCLYEGSSRFFRLRQPHAGVILLRPGAESDLNVKWQRLAFVLTTYRHQLD